MLKVQLQITDLELFLFCHVWLCLDFKKHLLFAQVNEVSIIFEKHLHNVFEKLHLLLSHINHQFYLANFTYILMKLVPRLAPSFIQPRLLYQVVQVSFIQLVVVK